MRVLGEGRGREGRVTGKGVWGGRVTGEGAWGGEGKGGEGYR